MRPDARSPSRPRPSSAPLAALPLLLGACAGPEIVNPEGVEPLAWEGCGGNFECATLTVPVDYEKKDGATFQIPVLRLPAAVRESRIGALFINPGGPGGSGVAWVRYAVNRLPAAVGDRFDIIGFDPRGVGASEPAIDCVDDLDAFVALDLSPDDPAERQHVIDETRRLAKGCDERSGDILPFVDTESVARDMDRLRASLGERTISYVGFSYGTLLGALYADRFPNQVRAFVLDGAIDPSLPGEAIIEGQALSFEEQLNDFLADCAENPICPFHSGGDPAAAYDALKASIEAGPMPALDDEGRSVGPGELWWGVGGALYSPTDWEDLAFALSAASTSGDASMLLYLSDIFTGRGDDGTYTGSLEQYQAVFSIDNPFPTDPAFYDAQTADLAEKAPRLGAYFAYSALPSGLWPLRAVREPAKTPAVGAPPILVVGTTRDPATPYAWSVALAAQLESGVLLTRNGQGHTGFAGKSACVDVAVSKYLIDLEAPAGGATCD